MLPSRGANSPKVGALSDDELVKIRRVCPSYVPDSTALVNYKVVIAPGKTDSGPVVAKVLRNLRAGLIDRFETEARAYELFAEHSPPCPTPRLFGHDPDTHVLIIAAAPGRPAAIDRFPLSVSSDLVDAIMAIGDAIQAWRPQGPEPAAGPDALKTVAAHFERGEMTEAEHGLLRRHLERLGDARAPAHGDLLLTNVLVGPDDTVTIIDWEHFAWYLPYRDAALLWATLGDVPEGRSRIESHVRDKGWAAWDAFLGNAALAILQEIHICANFDATPEGELRLGMLRDDWRRVAEALLSNEANDAATSQHPFPPVRPG